jgi:hypothetical protein
MPIGLREVYWLEYQKGIEHRRCLLPNLMPTDPRDTDP